MINKIIEYIKQKSFWKRILFLYPVGITKIFKSLIIKIKINNRLSIISIYICSLI